MVWTLVVAVIQLMYTSAGCAIKSRPIQLRLIALSLLEEQVTDLMFRNITTFPPINYLLSHSPGYIFFSQGFFWAGKHYLGWGKLN